MNPPGAASAPTPPPPRGDVARDAVADVLRDQAERARRRSAAPPPARDPTPLLWGISALAAVGTLWMLLAPPGVLRPPPVPAPPPAVVEAELRMTVAQAVLRLEAFREETGALPADLLEVFEGPEDVEGLVYERLDAGRFRLSGTREGAAVLFESGDPIADWMAGARRVMEGRAR